MVINNMKLIKTILSVFIVAFVLFFIFFLWGSSQSGIAHQINGVHTTTNISHNLPNESLNDNKIVIATYNIGYFSHLSNTGLYLDEDITESFQKFNKRPSKNIYNTAENTFQEIMKDKQINILAVQEVDFKSYRSHHANQGEIITSLLSFPYSSYIVTWDKTFVPYPYSFDYATRDVVSGQGVFSLHPITSQETVSIPQSGGILRKHFDFKKQIQIISIEIDKKVIYILHVHIDAFDANTNFKQGQILFDTYIKTKEKGPTIVLGDFNNDIKTETGENALSIFLNSDDIAHISQEPLRKDFYTYPSNNPIFPIDHILYDPEYFYVEKWEILNISEVSDHLPVIATLRLINKSGFSANLMLLET